MAKKKEEPKPTPSPEQFVGPAPTFEVAARQAPTIGPPEQFFGPEAQQRRLPTERLPAGFEPWRHGDQYDPGLWPSQDKARLQAMLNAAGLYGGRPYRAGDWTDTDASALERVLTFANAQGIADINEAVRRYATAATTESVQGPSAPRAPLVTRYANPEAVRQVVRQSSLTLMGRRLSDEEEARIVGGFQAQNVAAQQAQYAAGEAGGAVTEPLSAEEYAESQLGGTAEAGDQRYLDAFDRMVKTMTGTVVPGPTLTGRGGVR